MSPITLHKFVFKVVKSEMTQEKALQVDGE